VPEVFKQPDDFFAVGRSFVEVALDLAGRMAGTGAPDAHAARKGPGAAHLR
jgi:hypothetical protein